MPGSKAAGYITRSQFLSGVLLNSNAPRRFSRAIGPTALGLPSTVDSERTTNLIAEKVEANGKVAYTTAARPVTVRP